MTNLEIHVGAVQLLTEEGVITTELHKHIGPTSNFFNIALDQHKFGNGVETNNIVSPNMLTLEFCAGAIANLVGRRNSLKYIEASFVEPLYRGNSVDFTCAIKRDAEGKEGKMQFVGKVGERAVIIGHATIVRVS